MRHIALIILLISFLVTPSWAEPVGMVTSCTPEGEVVVNRGIKDNVTPGTRWFIYRSGKPLAEVEVVLVDDYSSNAKIIQGTGVQTGDRVTTDAFNALPKASEVKTQQKVAGIVIPKNQLTNRNPVDPQTMKEENLDTVTKNYNKLLAASSKRCKFSGGGGKKRRTSIDPMNVANVISPLWSGGYGLTWQNVVSVVPDEVVYNVGTKKVHKDCMLQVDVTWWNEALLNTYSDMLAFREGRTSLEQRLAMRNGLYAQKGLDRFVVFNVKMRNVGPGNVQVDPFHWHMYLVDSQGNKVKAERYDQVLDRTLAPEQEVEGSVYFLSVDAAGSAMPGKKAGPTVIFEDILAERAEVKF